VTKRIRLSFDVPTRNVLAVTLAFDPKQTLASSFECPLFEAQFQQRGFFLGKFANARLITDVRFWG